MTRLKANTKIHTLQASKKGFFANLTSREVPPDHLDDMGVGSDVPRLLELLKLVHMVEGGNGFVTKVKIVM